MAHRYERAKGKAGRAIRREAEGATRPCWFGADGVIQCEGLTAKLAGRPLFIPSKGKIWRHFALGTRARKTMQYSELETKDLSMAATVSPQTLPAHGFFQALARNGARFCWPVYYRIPSEREGRMQQFVILFQEVLRGRVGKGDLRGRRRMAWIFLLRL